MTTMRERWGRRRKPLPEPPDVQPRHRGPHTWHWWDLLAIAFVGWLLFRALQAEIWLLAAWLASVLILLSWGIAMPKDGSLGELARRAVGSGRGRLIVWGLFFVVAAGVGYAVYWIRAQQ